MLLCFVPFVSFVVLCPNPKSEIANPNCLSCRRPQRTHSRRSRKPPRERGNPPVKSLLETRNNRMLEAHENDSWARRDGIPDCLGISRPCQNKRP
jgi:hypothetical protein